MNETGIIEEYYFDDYYRVLVMVDGTKYVVSVDVYYVGWNYDEYKELCIGEICLLVKELTPIGRIDSINIEKIVVVGTRVGNKLETINVKWIMDSKPGDNEMLKIFKNSWRVARGEPLDVFQYVKTDSAPA